MRKSQKREYILRIILLMFIILISTTFGLQVNANNDFELEMKEFSEDYIRYLQLPDEEKEGIYAPRMYDIEASNFVPRNQLKIMRSTGATYAKKYSLRETLPERNLIVKNQKMTNMCWTFASLSSLETNLALSDHFNNRAIQEYDFSERHMEYATVRDLDGGPNMFGFNRKIDGGSRSLNKFDIPYLTNGMGAINESDMPFSMDLSMKPVSYIQNKEVQTQVYDIIEFPDEKSNELMDQMKDHIKNYGSINVYIHGAQPNQEYVEKNGQKYYCYSNETGAIYCDDDTIFPTNHAVSIIGWDDEYSIENFNKNNKPENPGAWIIRNSWGTGTFEYEEMRQYMYEVYTLTEAGKNFLKDNNINWTSPSDISNQMLENWASQNGYIKKANNTFYSKIGDNGIMYVSYEDCNVYSYMTGIVKAENEISYDNLYQYDELGSTVVLNVINPKNEENVWLGSIFEKQTTGTEYITQVSVYAPEKYTCKVWVNPNSDSKLLKDMVQAKLKDGESETFEAGYHTIEFAEPIKINSDKFFVALQIKTENSTGYSYIALEARWEIDSPWNCAKIEQNKTFVNIDEQDYYFDDSWKDLSKEKHSAYTGVNINGADSTLKVFTVNEIKDDTIREIKVTTPPNKTEYYVGEDFDKTGMVVTAYLNNGDTREIKDYTIVDGKKLGANQTEVKIKYEMYETAQKINVVKNPVEKLVIKQLPKKLEYDAGDDFDPEGMIVEVTFKDGSVKEVTDFEIPDGKDLKNGQTTVKVVYQEGNETLEIKVNPNPVVDLNVTTMPSKTEYVEGQDFDTKGMVVTVTYQNGKVKNVTSYTVENGTKLTKGQNKVIVKFEDKSYEVEITVKEKKPLGIDIKTAPTKLKYTQYKEELDVKGGVITVKYNDGSSEEVAMTTSGVTFEGFDNTKLGKNTITVKYLNLEKTFEVEIIEEAKDLPENSDFSKAISKNKLMKMYYYTNNTEKNYAEITVEISGITKATVNDSLSYKYYLSSNQAEKTISDEKWVELKNVQITDGKLRFTINTKDLTNYDEVSKSNNLYLYVREIATRNGQTKVLDVNAKDISKPEQKEEYIDGIKKENPSGGGISKPGDDSQASGKYPYTGKKVMILIGFILITLGVFGFIRYKNIDK